MSSLYGFRNNTSAAIAIGSSISIAAQGSYTFYNSDTNTGYNVKDIQTDLMGNPAGVNYLLAQGSLVYIVDNTDATASDFYTFWGTFYGAYIASATNTVTTVTAPISTSVVTSPDTVRTSGFFVAPINTGNTLSVTAVNPALSNCNSQFLQASKPSISRAGQWRSYYDTYGTTITPLTTNLDSDMSTKGYLDVSINMKGNSAGYQYPFAGVAFDLEYNGEASLPSSKTTHDVSMYTSVRLTYSATTSFKMQLVGQADTDGANHFYQVPVSASQTTITVPWASFSQPSWKSGAQTRAIPTSALVGIQFQYDTDQSLCAFKLYKVELVGTGPFLPSRVTLATKYSAITTQLVTKWFKQFYIENTAKTQGRIAWISGTNVDPSVTVSEGIGYGMLLALMVDNASGASNTFRQKFDRLWAYYQAFSNGNGLMNWKTSGFYTDGNGSVIGSGSASDADVDVCKALCLAYEKFMDAGYLSAARAMMTRIWNKDVMSVTTVAGTKKLFAPGDAWNSYANPSYAKMAALKLFALYDNDVSHDWITAYADNIWMLQQNQANSTTYSLPSNWCDYNGIPSAGVWSLGFGWDACRTLYHVAESYNWFGCPNCYAYLQTISQNATLLGIVTGATPMTIQLSIAPGGTFFQRWTGSAWADEYESERSASGLVCLLPAYSTTSALTEAKIEELLQVVLNYTDDDDDYFRLALKAFVLSIMTGKSTRYAPDPGAASKLAHITHVAGSAGSTAGSHTQFAHPLDGSSPMVRVCSNGTWSAWTTVGGSSSVTLSGDVTGASSATTVAKINGNTVPANAAGALVNNGTGTLTWQAMPTAVTLTGDVSGASGANTVDKIKGNAVPANAAGALVNNGTGTLTWQAMPTSVTLAGDVSGASGANTVNKLKGNTVPANGVGQLTNDGSGNLTWASPTAPTLTITGDGSATGTTSLALTVNKLKGNTVPANGIGALTNDGAGNLTWATGTGTGGGVPNVNNVTVAFGVNNYEVRTVVANTAVTVGSLIVPQVTTEDFIIQDVQVYVTNIVAGTGYTLITRAPNGASGNLSVRVSIQG